MLRAGVLERRCHPINARADEIPHFADRVRRAAGGPAHAASSAEFGPADGPADTALYTTLLHREPEDLAGRRSGAGDGWRDRDLGRSEYPFQLSAQRRRQVSCRSRRYQPENVPGRMVDRKIDAVAAWARRIPFRSSESPL